MLDYNNYYNFYTEIMCMCYNLHSSCIVYNYNYSAVLKSSRKHFCGFNKENDTLWHKA